MEYLEAKKHKQNNWSLQENKLFLQYDSSFEIRLNLYIEYGTDWLIVYPLTV